MKLAEPWLETIIDRISERVLLCKHPLLEDEVIEFVEKNIESAYPIFDYLLSLAAEHHAEPTSEQQACLLLICEILSYVHYAIEQNRSWANDFSCDFQSHVAKHAFKPEIDAHILQNILDILHQTELDIIDDIRYANAQLLEDTHYDENVIEAENITELLEEIAEAGSGCEFDMYEHLLSQTYQIIPIEVQIIMVAEMVHSQHPLIVNAAVLMLMHPEPVIREQTAQLLTQGAKAIPATSLRRLIVMRNWLPEEERPAVDKLIRSARKAGVECESWPSASIDKVMATAFDGLGSQSLLILSKQNNRFHLSGLLLKENQGIREPLLFRTNKKNESESIIREMSSGSASLTVNSSYLNLAVAHFLAINVQKGVPPSPLLLHFAEVTGHADWRAEKLAEDVVMQELLEQLGWETLNETEIKKIMNKSRSWLEQTEFSSSWFEQDAEVDERLDEIIKEFAPLGSITMQNLVTTVCLTILEPRRVKWQNRLLWMALWAKANTRKRGPKWQEFFVLAKAIADGKPLQEIPLMNAISTETIYAASAREVLLDQRFPP